MAQKMRKPNVLVINTCLHKMIYTISYHLHLLYKTQVNVLRINILAFMQNQSMKATSSSLITKWKQWIDSGPTVDLQWTNSGSTVDPHWIYSGSAVDLQWICSGPAVEQQWIHIGYTVEQQWTTSGSAVDQQVEQQWISSGSTVD